MSELGLNKPPVAPHSTSQLALFESKCPWYLKVKPQHRTQQSIVRSHQELNVNKKLTKDDVLGRPGSWRAPGGHRASLITSPWYHHRHNCQSLSKLRSHPGQNASQCVQLLIFHWRINYFFLITWMSRASECHAKQALFVENNTEEIFEAALEQGKALTLLWCGDFCCNCPIKRSCPSVRPSLYALCSMLIAGFILADKVNDCLIYNQLFCPSSDSSYPCFSVGSSMKSWVPSCWHRAELSSVYLTLVLVGTGGAGWGPSLVGSLQWHCSDPGLARGDNLIRLIIRCHHQAMSPPEALCYLWSRVTSASI